MPCIGESGKVVGVISLSDIAQRQIVAGQMLREVTTREVYP